MSDLKRCAACGMPAHRYGRNEGQERFDPMACINGLLGRFEALTSEETIERAAKALGRRLRYEYPQLNFLPGPSPSYREIVRDVLRVLQEEPK